MTSSNSPAGEVGDHHWVAVGVPTGGFETDRLQVRHEDIGRLAAGIGVGGIGGDALDAQQVEQALCSVVQVLVYVTEDAIQGDVVWVICSGVAR